MKEEKVLRTVRLFKQANNNNPLTGTAHLAKILPKEEKEPYNVPVIVGGILFIVVIGLVIGSIIFGIIDLLGLAVFILPISILMYIIGLVDISRRNERGKAMAIVGLIFDFLLVVAGFLALIAFSIVQ